MLANDTSPPSSLALLFYVNYLPPGLLGSLLTLHKATFQVASDDPCGTPAMRVGTIPQTEGHHLGWEELPYIKVHKKWWHSSLSCEYIIMGKDEDTGWWEGKTPIVEETWITDHTGSWLLNWGIQRLKYFTSLWLPTKANHITDCTRLKISEMYCECSHCDWNSLFCLWENEHNFTLTSWVTK